MICVVALPAALWASPLKQAGLPPVVYADTEVSTNVEISAWQRGAAKFYFSLTCIVTPSNNVEVAFGVDADGDGVLAAAETDLVVGWDCGAWFVRHGVDGERFTEAAELPDGTGTLVWDYRLTAATSPERLTLSAEGAADNAFHKLFDEPPSPAWLHDRRWNLMRLTGRGLAGSGETFTVGTPSDPTAIMFR